MRYHGGFPLRHNPATTQCKLKTASLSSPDRLIEACWELPIRMPAQ